MKLPSFLKPKRILPVFIICLVIFSYFFTNQPQNDSYVVIDDPLTPLSDSPDIEPISTSPSDFNEEEFTLNIDEVLPNDEIEDIDELNSDSSLELLNNNEIVSNIEDSDNNTESYDSTPVNNSTDSETVTQKQTALFYLNTKNLDYSSIDYKKCYYVGKGSVIEEICNDTVQDVIVDEAPEYNGAAGRYDISWDYIDNSNGFYCVYASVTPGENTQTEKTAYYYLNIRKLDLEDNPYQKCYYVGKGSVLEDEDYKGNITTSTSLIPEYDGSKGDYIISWDKIAYNPDKNYYMVFGNITSSIQTEEPALYYLNTRNLDLTNDPYQKCYYVGKGSVMKETDPRGNETISTSTIPAYNGEVGDYIISWDKISYVSNKYMVFGNVVNSVQTEATAYYYLNIRNLDLSDDPYKKCYYVGKGSVIKDTNPRGEETISTSVIPDYNGEVGDYIISWDKISNVSNKYYMVFGQVTKRQTDYNNLDALIKSNAVQNGDVVTTKGFYSAGDGGAAKYTISNTSGSTTEGYHNIKLSNGLYAILNISDNTICANQFGAYGDGIHDDVPALQAIVNLGYNVSLCSGQTYKFISDALYLKNSVTINGNNATILADDTYTPQKKDSQYYLIRNIYGNKLDSFSMNNLSIKVNFSSGRISGREFVVVSPLLVKNVALDHVDVETSKTLNCITCVWVDNGCDSVKINKCNFINRTSGATGGALWITSRTDKVFSDHSAIKSCSITNTYLFCSSADEVLALWGTNDFNATIKDCTIEGDITAQGKTRVVNIATRGDNHANFNVTIDNCDIKSNCNTDNTSSYYDSILGIGTDYPSNTVVVNITNSRIGGNVYGALIFPSGFKSEYISRFDANNRTVTINFEKCKIDCSSTVTGAAMGYYDTSAEYPSHAWDCRFTSCQIKCNTAFAYLYVPGDTKYYTPKIEIEDCDIQVTDAKAFICQAEKSASIDLDISDTDIVAAGVDDIVEPRNSRQRNLTTQKNAVDQTTVSEVSINGNEVTE